MVNAAPRVTKTRWFVARYDPVDLAYLQVPTATVLSLPAPKNRLVLASVPLDLMDRIITVGPPLYNLAQG